ncbi:MAG TPA: hypothetical protein VGR57_07015, partial [Ktedonobacterales bacterium]|nr:hypothetical protein [Ktedonobacterales bacterium]
ELERLAGHALYRASTRANLRNLPAGFIEDLNYSGELARQEIEGQFVAFAGLVYALDRAVHVVAREKQLTPPWRRVVGGVDWGYTNPTAAVVFGLDGDSRAHQLAEFYQRRASFAEVVVPALLELTRAHGVACWHCDSEDPGHIADLRAAVGKAGLACQVVAAKKGAGSVSDGIQTVTSLLSVRGDGKPGLTIEPGCVNTLAEYGMYRYPTVMDGQEVRRDPREEPIKLSDHALDATRYALHGELGGAGRTDAYLSGMGQWLKGPGAKASGNS